jgi:hypothetical protein
MSFRKEIFLALGFLFATMPLTAFEPGPHPRLYISLQPTDKVPGLETLRARIRKAEYARAWDRVKNSKSAADRALVFLVTGDTVGISVVRKALSETVKNYNFLAEHALAYDWAYGALDEKERKEFARRLMDSAEAVARQYSIPTAYHNMCRGRHMAQGMAMLAAWHEDPRAEKLLPQVEKEMQWLLEVLADSYPVNDLEGRAGYGGGWPEGYDYDRHGSFYALQLLLAWRSVGLGDLLSQSDYWKDKLPWLIYGTAPGGSFILPYEDNDWPIVMPHDREMMTFLEGEFREGLASYWVDTFADTVKVRPFWEFLFSDPSVKNIPLDGLPTSALIPGLGLALLRSSWADDASYVSFHCGPWFTYHQHAAQGSFTVWRGRPLVIEPGVYDGEVHEHYVNWRIRTISHNCITVLDSTERFQGPEAVPEPANDGGQIIQNWTLKPSTVAEWRAQRKMRAAGQVTAFLTDPTHDFVSGEAAGAYNPDKVRRWCRRLLFIKPDWIILSDLVVSGNPFFPKTLFIHSPEEIQVQGYSATTVSQGKAPLKIYSLLPQGALLKAAGGPGRTFEYGGNNWKTVPAYNGQFDVAWRLEIEAPSQDTTVFLTALYLGDPQNSGTRIPEAKLLTSSGKTVALSLGDGRYRVEFDSEFKETYRLSGSGVTYSIMGAVRQEGLPVEGAKLDLEGVPRREAQTDHQGRYNFSGLIPGQYRIKLENSDIIHEVRISDHSIGEVNFE